jgi:chromosome segregation ATPase
MLDNFSLQEHLPDSSSTQSPERNSSLSYVEKLEAEIAEQNKAKLDLGGKIKDKDLKIDGLNKQIEKLQKQQIQSNNSSEIVDLESQREGLRRLCTELMDEKKELQRQLQEANSTIERLETQLEKLRKTKRMVDKHAEELQEQLDDTKRELTQIKAERDEYAKRADSSQVIVENRDTIEQFETTASVTIPQETVGQAHSHTSTSLASTVLRESSHKATSHRRRISGSKHSHSSKKEGKVTGYFEDVFGRGVKMQIACPR